MTFEIRRPKLDPAVAKTRLHVRETLKEAGVLGTGKIVMVALSGGADSLALAAATAHEARKGGFKVATITVNHNLQEGSQEVAEQAIKKANQFGIDTNILYNVDVENSPEAGGPENAARDARYAAFAHTAAKLDVDYILTAHTKNDQAEQVLLSLVRGSGTRAISGIPPKRGIYLRPFLDISREEILAACDAQGITPWVDPHNAEEKYTRVRIRKNILPLIQEELGNHVIDSLATTASIAREDADMIDFMASQFYASLKETLTEEHPNCYRVSHLETIKFDALRNRVIRLAVEDLIGVPPSRKHTLMVAALLTDWHGQKDITVSGGTVTRKDGWLIFKKLDVESK